MNALATFFSAILFAGHWLVSAANNATVIIAKPQSVTVEEGKEVILECILGNKTAQCLWSKNGTIFKPSGDNGYRYASGEDCTIIITNASRIIHDAFYRCGPLRGDQMSDPSAKVSVLVRPQNPEIHYKGNPIHNGGNLTVSEDESYITLKCMVRNGDPAASIQWLMDSKELAAKFTTTTSWDNKLKTAHSELVLQAKDSHLQHRTLQCNAIHLLYNSSNNMMSTQVKIILPGVVINVTAEFVTNTSERIIIATVGSTVEMMCNAIGDPILEYVWERRSSEKPAWEIFDSKSNITTHIAEKGKFRCGAKSKANSYVYSEELQVELDTSQILTVIAHPKDALVTNGEDVLLQCIFSRRPFRCDWLRDEHPFIPDGDLYVFVGNIETNDCSILIKSVNANLEATYTCESPAVGMQGGARSNMAKVTIQNMPQSPEIWYQERALLTGEYLKIKFNATAITVYCRVKDANPPAETKWFVNNVQHYGFERHEISTANRNWITTTNTLNITITEDMKNKRIRCTAKQSPYTKNESATYAIMSIPSQTTRVHAYIPEIDTEKPIVVGPEVTVTMFCDADGDPEPYYEWKFHQPNSNDRWTLSSNEQNISVTKKPGIYTCTARNEYNIRGTYTVSNEITIEIKYPYEVNLGAVVGAVAAFIFVMAAFIGITLYAFSHQIWCFEKVTAL